MKLLRNSFAAALAACFMTVVAFAASDPSGTWKWTQQGRQGAPGMERSLKLELKDGALTGTLLGTQGGQFQIPDTVIGDASFKDGVISFTVTMDFGGTKRVTKYEGKLDGDTIKGSTERPGRGEGAAPVKSDWEAKRAK
jgi:hypothetical protein